MTPWKWFCASMLIAGMLSAQQAIEDPVMNARNQRASLASAGEGDLPPVPRGILEPPPLPPPVVHVKDTKGYRAPKRGKRSVVRSRRGAKPLGRAPLKKRRKHKP
jgi:hypothetical protein